MSEHLTVSTPEMSRILGISDVHLGRLVRAGVLPEPEKRGAWSIARTVPAFCAYLRAGGDDAKQKAETLRLTTAKREKTEAALEEQRLRTAQVRQELLPRDEVLIGITASFARVRAKLLSLPSKMASRVIGESNPAAVQESLREAVHEALNELASTVVVGIPPADVRRAAKADRS